MEQNCDILSCKVIQAVWNSNGVNVTVTSISPLAGIIPEKQNHMR